MSWNPNQGQDPNQAGGPTPSPRSDGAAPPRSNGAYGAPQPGYGQQQGGGYQQQPAYGQQPYGQPGGYQPPPGNYQPPPGGYQQQQYGQPGGYQQPYGAPPAYAAPSTMDPKVAAGLSYLIFIVGIIFFVIEKRDRFVRFHAMQSILLHVAVFVLSMAVFIMGIVLALTPLAFAGGLMLTCLFPLVIIGFVVLWIILMVYAFQGKMLKLPIIGDLAERWSAPAAGM